MPALVEDYAANDTGRDWVVGDIHGCFDLLDHALDQIDFEPAADRLFSVGDLMDRGPASHRAPDYLAQPWFFAVRGNHEQMLLDATTPDVYQRDNQRLWHMNGGAWFKDVSPETRARIEAAVAAMPYAFEIALSAGSRAAIVHADVVADSWSRTRDRLMAGRDAAELAELLWSRDRVSRLSAPEAENGEEPSVTVADVDLIFFGHTPLQAPIASANTRWLDTGAVFGNALAIAELAGDGRVWCFDATTGESTEGWRQR